MLVPHDAGMALFFEDAVPKVLALHLYLHPRLVLGGVTAGALAALHLPTNRLLGRNLLPTSFLFQAPT